MLKPLTSLRFFAAAGVVFDHMGYPYRTGRLGVIFFFVLSGFILTYVHSREFDTNGKIEVRRFYAKRIARIFPLHWLTMLLAVPIFLHQNWPRSFFLVARQISLTQTFIPDGSNFLSFNAVSWTLSNEWLFYLLFPVLISIIVRLTRDRDALQSGILLAGIYLAMMAISLISPQANPGPERGVEWWLVVVAPYTNILLFVLGICTATAFMALRERLQSLSRATCTIAECAITIALFAVHYAMWRAPIFRNESVQYAPLLGAAVFIFAINRGRISNILSHRWFVALGELSFALYMVHYLLIEYLALQWPIVQTPAASAHAAVIQSAVGVLAVAIAWIFHTRFELPAQTYLTNILLPRRAIPNASASAQ